MLIFAKYIYKLILVTNLKHYLHWCQLTLTGNFELLCFYLEIAKTGKKIGYNIRQTLLMENFGWDNSVYVFI